MPHRPCPDLMDEPAPAETPAMTEAAAAIERGEGHRAMLARLAELGMAMAEAIVEQTRQDGAAEAGAAFAKVAQAVRYTIALQDRLAEGVGRRRIDLMAERRTRRDEARLDHERDKDEAIRREMDAAARERHGDSEVAERLIEQAGELLDVGDDYHDYLQRPVGETIAKLCRHLGLDPDWCVRQGEAWVTKSEPYNPFRASGAPFSPDPRDDDDPRGEACWSRDVSPWPTDVGGDARGPREGARRRASSFAATGPPL